MSGLRIGIDVGGTFTDAFVLDGETGSLAFRKVPSTPSAPEDAVVTAVSEILSIAGGEAGDVTYFVHGTTLAMNTLVQRSGTRAGLLVTKGFRDILEIGRGRLPVIHDFNAQKVLPLIPRDLVAEVTGRLYATGEEETPLDLDEVEAQARFLVGRGAAAIAILFLHSYRNPAHELAALERLRSVLPQIYICASSTVWPRAREYERAMATVINAYVGGPMERYYAGLRAKLTDLGVAARVYVTRSAGGIMSAENAARTPVETLLSGPASGVLGAAALAAAAGERRVVCFDMGGTTADVSIVDGEPRYTFEQHAAGFPLSMPAIDVVSIGAGGGSIAWIDPGGVLRVGPRSAGARPGPAAYALGGEEPTVTDAYLALGFMHPDRFLGGELRLDAARAGGALAALARKTGESIPQIAWQIVTVANANMYGELMLLLSRQGAEAADFTLVAYGGAGPTQAFLLAEEMAMDRVLVPPMPGGVCALGCLIADFRSDFVKSLYVPLASMDEALLQEAFEGLERIATDWLDAERVVVQERRYVRSAEMRYVGQSFEVSVPITKADPALVSTAFHARHRAVYGFADERAETEIVDIRVQLIGAMPSAVPQVPPKAMELPEKETRRVWFDGVQHDASIIPRAQIGEGDIIRGPAIVEQYDSTVVLTPGWDLSADRIGNLVGQRRRIGAALPVAAPAKKRGQGSLVSKGKNERRVG